MRFNNPEHALRWAYETVNSPIVKISSVNKMRGQERGASEELTPHDRHAQAAFILSLCARVLTPLQMAYINVQFGRDASGIDLLARQLAANFGTGAHRRRGIEQIIRAHCGEKIGLRDLKKSLSCRTLKAVSLRNRGYDFLDAIHARAMDAIWAEMCGRDLQVATG